MKILKMSRLIRPDGTDRVALYNELINHCFSHRLKTYSINFKLSDENATFFLLKYPQDLKIIDNINDDN